jgi:hypothetical protein
LRLETGTPNAKCSLCLINFIMEKIVSPFKDQKDPTGIIDAPSHGMMGRRIVNKEGEEEYDLVWYHRGHGWMNRQEAWAIWTTLSLSERWDFPNVLWWP